jgi:hypothetical protein
MGMRLCKPADRHLPRRLDEGRLRAAGQRRRAPLVGIIAPLVTAAIIAVIVAVFIAVLRLPAAVPAAYFPSFQSGVPGMALLHLSQRPQAAMQLMQRSSCWSLRQLIRESADCIRPAGACGSACSSAAWHAAQHLVFHSRSRYDMQVKTAPLLIDGSLELELSVLRHCWLAQLRLMQLSA